MLLFCSVPFSPSYHLHIVTSFYFLIYFLIFHPNLSAFLSFPLTVDAGVYVMDVFSTMASATQAVFSGLDFMHMQHKVEEAQKKEDDRLGEQSL